MGEGRVVEVWRPASGLGPVGGFLSVPPCGRGLARPREEDVEIPMGPDLRAWAEQEMSWKKA